MIRIVLGLFVFSVVLCAWIVINPSRGEERGRPVAAVSEPELSNTEVEVTRDQPSEVEVFQPALREVTRVIAPRPSLRIGEETLDQATAGVLAGLGLQAPTLPAADEMGAMTSSILSEIRAVTGAGPDGTEPSALSDLVAKALQAGETDAAIDELVNTAAVAGAVSVPNAMVTSDGRVDTSVLLASIVNQARVAAGQPPAAAPEGGIGGEGVEVHVVQTAAQTEQFRFYTVGDGDSLGAIAIKFYGDAVYFPRIFDANRATLSSPDRIRAGQRLVIPNL